MNQMTKVRRLVNAVLNAMILLMILLVAGVGFAAERVQIEIWGNQGHLEHLKPLVEEFNASQNRITVTIPGKNEFPDTILTAHLANQLPAILESDKRWTQIYGAQGLLADLTPFIEREGAGFLKDFLPALLPESEIDGRYYALPSWTEFFMIYHNTEVVDSLGLASPHAGWTWDDLKQIGGSARRFDSDGNPSTLPLIAEHQNSFDIPLLLQAGGTLVTDDFRVAVNSTEMRETIDYILDLMDTGILHHTRVDASVLDKRAHGAAFVSTGTFRQNYWFAQESPMVATPPLRKDANARPVLTPAENRSWAIMNVEPEVQEAAWEVVKWLLSPEVNGRWTMSLGYPPAVYSTWQSPAFQDYARSHPSMKILEEQYLTLPSAVSWPAELFRTGNEIRTQVPAAYDALLRREVGPEEFISNLDRFLNQVLKTYMETSSTK